MDVFEDQLSPYGVWVDDPDTGHVFIPEQANYVPYTNGHWVYTSVGFVWQSPHPWSWATSHYGRWAYSRNFNRWTWLPDTEWGPAWVEWNQTPDHFGWAPMAPTVLVNAGYRPPIESWHYCPSEHVLDINVTRYYEPRDRVVVIHRDARPIQHYATVSRVKVVVGPPASVLRTRRVTVSRVRVEPKIIGRVTVVERRQQVERARERKTVIVEQNRRKIESNVTIKRAVEAHPAVRVNGRVEVGHGPVRPEPRREEPKREAPVRTEPHRVETRPEPKREEPKREEPRREAPVRTEPKREEPKRVEQRPEPKREEPKREAPVRTEPKRDEPRRVETKPEPHRVETPPKSDPKHADPKHEAKPDPKNERH